MRAVDGGKEPEAVDKLRDEFEEGDFSALLEPLRKSYRQEFAQLQFYECESCEDSSYLRVTAYKRTPKKDKPGEVDEESRTVVDLIKVPHGLHQALVERMEEARRAENQQLAAQAEAAEFPADETDEFDV